MNNHIHSHRDQSSALSASAVQRMEKRGGTFLADNRPAKVVQRQPSGKAVVQRVTSATWTTQNFQYNDENTNALRTQMVGRRMVAQLDPNDLRTGNSTTSQEMPDLFDGLKAHWDPGGKRWVRGHLLNDHLGGPNSDPNLFPITGHANGDHLQEVESHVKDWMRAGRNVRYEVNAYQDGGNMNGLRNAAGRFVCYAYTTSGAPREVVNKTILSTPHTRVGGGGGPKSGVAVHDRNWWQHDNTQVGAGNASNVGLHAANAGMNNHNRATWNTNHIRRGYFWNDYAL